MRTQHAQHASGRSSTTSPAAGARIRLCSVGGDAGGAQRALHTPQQRCERETLLCGGRAQSARQRHQHGPERPHQSTSDCGTGRRRPACSLRVGAGSSAQPRQQAAVRKLPQTHCAYSADAPGRVCINGQLWRARQPRQRAGSDTRRLYPRVPMRKYWA